MKSVKTIVVIILFAFAFTLLTHHILLNDLFFDSDIGRDFLLIEDVVSNKDITLLGPRADGIPGMFFGPHWIYLNIPIYLIGGGNPVIVASSWLILMLISIFSVFYVGKRIFDKNVGIIGALLYSYLLVPYAAGFTQSFFAPLLAPWIVYYLILYIKEKKALYISLTLLLSGILYQFQPAFGMITIPFTSLIVSYQILKNKNYSHVLAFIFLLIPFALFFISEAKTNFLQTNSFITHVTSDDKEKILFVDLLKIRVQLLLNIFNFTKLNILLPIFIIIFSYIIYSLKNTKQSLYKNFYIIVFIYIFGFFILSFLFKGRFNDYHTWGFLSLVTISIAGISQFVKNRKVYHLIITLVLILAVVQAVYFRIWWTNNYKDDYLSWKTNKEVAEYIFSSEKKDFGFYVYSFDEFGYSMKYAMSHIDKKYDINSSLCKKDKTTYLIYGPSPSGKISNPKFWKEERIKIYKQPEESLIIDDFVVEKYKLNSEELYVEADPNIICNLHFR